MQNLPAIGFHNVNVSLIHCGYHGSGCDAIGASAAEIIQFQFALKFQLVITVL
jgi:hypothetical protein